MNKLNLTKETCEEFGKQFLTKYLLHGFGSLPKREIDTLVFYLQRNSKEFSDKSLYELSTELKVSQSKVKGLTLEGTLRHGEINHKAVIGRIVQRYMDQMQSLELRDGYCEVALADPIERREFEQAVNLTRHHVEYGINRDILKIRPIRLLEIILQNVENGEKEFITLVKSHLDDTKKQAAVLDKSLSFRDKINKLGEEINDKGSLISLLSGAAVLL